MNFSFPKITKKRLIKLTIIFVVLSLLSIISIGEVYFSYSRHRPYPVDPTTLGASKIILSTEDGVKITSWYRPNNSSTLVIVSHGHFDNAGMMFERYIPIFIDLKWDVFAIDLRNHGKSGDKAPISYGMNEYRDVDAAIKWVKENGNWTKIIVFGTSMGAATSLLSLDHTDFNIYGLILDSMFVNIENTFKLNMNKHHIPSKIYFHPIKIYLNLRYASYGYTLDDYPNLIEAIKHVSTTTPILLLRGSSDREVTIADYNKIKTEVPVVTDHELDAEHSQLFRDIEFQSVVEDWYSQLSSKLYVQNFKR